MALPYSISRGHYLTLQALVPCFGIDNSDASLLIFDHKIELTIFDQPGSLLTLDR
jgi:hypothetical protein